MKVCVLYSGGKDSNLALFKTFKEMDVVCLVSLSPRSEESALFHYPNVNLVKLQAKALNLPIIMSECRDDEESSIKALRESLKKAKRTYGIEGVVTGVIRSTYQAARFQRVCDELDLWCFNPIWLRDEISVLKEAIDSGFEIIFTRIAGYPFSKDLLGKRLNEKTLKELKKIERFINLAGEGGEYETFVLDMPLFKKKIFIVDYYVVGSEYDATLIVKSAKLVDKC